MIKLLKVQKNSFASGLTLSQEDALRAQILGAGVFH